MRPGTACRAAAFVGATAIAAGGCGAAHSSTFGGPADDSSTDGGTSHDPSADGGPPDYQSAAPPQQPLGGDDSSSDALAVDDTGTYRVDGDRLYYLSGDRGLLVFDVTDVDHPALVGSSPLSGDPQAMYLVGNVAVVVFADWYGTTTQGQPFHGSLVRALDCTDPTNIRVVGDLAVDGYVQSSRLVGDVLYTVGTDRGFAYGSGWSQSQPSPRAVVTSIGLSTGAPQKIAEQTIPGDDGVFAFAPTAILVSTVASDHETTALQYVDVHDPAGAIALRGSIAIDGPLEAWGICANTGGWALDFADGVHAHAVTGRTSPYVSKLVTVDFSNPDAPQVSSTSANLLTAGDTQGIVPRFDVDPTTGRATLYVGHTGSQDASATALDVYDLSDPASPKQVASAAYQGDVCSLQLNGHQLVTVSSYSVNNDAGVDVQDLDVTSASAPAVLGSTDLTANRDVFPAVDATRQVTFDSTASVALVPVLLNHPPDPYTFGLEVLSLGSSTLSPQGLAPVSDAIERGIFVQDRAYAFTRQTLTVFDVSNPAAPQETGGTRFGTYVYAAEPIGSSVAEVSTDALSSAPTDVRTLPATQANDAAHWAAAKAATVAGQSAEVFANGSLLYLVTSSCADATCQTYTRWVSVVDMSSGTPVARGSLQLPPLASNDPYGAYSTAYDGWYAGPDVVQVAATTLALRRPNTSDPLHVVDLSNADAPTVSSAAVMPPGGTWWGDMQVLDGTFYVTTFTPSGGPCSARSNPGCVGAYHIVPVDVHDPADPQVGAPVSVPGIPFGVSSANPNTLYLVDYAWSGGVNETNRITACTLADGRCALQGSMSLGGWIGQPFLQDDRAYATISSYDEGPAVPTQVHRIDLTKPQSPIDGVVQTPWGASWGSLLAVSGDAALVTSGWPSFAGADVFRMNGTAAPVYVQSVREPIFGPGPLVRQGQTLYVPGGFSGVQAVIAP